MNNIEPSTAKEKWQEKLKYKVNTLYALTINPDDRHQFIDKKQWAERLKSCHGYMVKLFKDACVNGTYYHLWEEVSEVTQSKLSRYHVHGVICFETEEALKYWLLEQTIFLMPTQWELKEVDNKEKWLSYCKKQALLGYVTNIFNLDKYLKER